MVWLRKSTFSIMFLLAFFVSGVDAQICRVDFLIGCDDLEPTLGVGCDALPCTVLSTGFVFCPEPDMEVVLDNEVRVIRDAEPGESGHLVFQTGDLVFCAKKEDCGNCENYDPLESPFCGVHAEFPPEPTREYLDLDPLINARCAVQIDP